MTLKQENIICKTFFEKCGMPQTERQKYMILLTEALDSQVAKKPEPYECFVPMYTCPRCQNRIVPTAMEYGNSIDNYCKHCGQKLDWSDEDGATDE